MGSAVKRLRVAVLLGVLLWAHSASAQISFDAASGGSLFSLTFSHTVGACSNRALVVSEFDDTGGSNLLTAVTWNTTEALTKIAQIQSPGDRWISLWYLLNPTSTTANVTLVTTAGAFKGSAISLCGVSALDVSGTDAKNTPGSGDTSVVLLGVATNAWIVSALKENSGVAVSWFNATERAATVANGHHMADGGPFSGATAVTGTYAGPTSVAMISASFTPAGGAATTQPPCTLHLLGVGCH